MSRWNLAWLLGVTAVTMVGLSLSYSFSTTPVSIHDRHDNVRLMIDVMDQVQAHYVKPLDDKGMRQFTEDAINGALEKLDPHSGFMGKEDYTEFNKHSEAEFGGVGIRLRVESGFVFVETPLVGTPAYNAGILAGDLIVKVDGKSTKNKTSREVVDMIQGKVGTQVKLTVIHPGKTEEEEQEYEMTRALIEIDSVLGDTPVDDAAKKWDYIIDKENKIAYIRIVAFTQKTVPELIKVVQELQDEGMKGLIIDLRGNPGGLLSAAVDVSGMFLEKGKTVVSTKSRTKADKTYHSQPPEGMPATVPGNIPIIILINRYSASASEIVAAALQDHLRAIIIGERSFGKGSVQNIIPMEGGTTALKLTTASYWRPSGKNMHRFPDSKKEDDWGVKPDIEVKVDTQELIDYLKYRRAKDVLHKKGVKTSDKDSKALEFKDRVLEKAREVILKEMKKQDKKGAAAPAAPGASTALNWQPSQLPAAAGGSHTMYFWCHEMSVARSFIEGVCWLEQDRQARWCGAVA